MLTMAGQELPRSAVMQGRYLRRRSNQTVAMVVARWHEHRSDDFNQAYADSALGMLDAIDSAQSDIATYMRDTTPDVMRDMGSKSLPAPEFDFDVSTLIGVAGNGTDTFSNLWSSVMLGKKYVGEGYATDQALAMIDRDFALRTRTLLADTARTSSMMAARSRDFTATYVRALTPPSCARCVILAGQPSGRTPFERHPHCDCTAVWSTDEAALATHYANPRDYLDSLSDEDLSTVLRGDANARAYRDGADLNQLVNAYGKHSGVRSAQYYGAQIRYTTAGTTKRGLAYLRMKQAGYVKAHIREGSKYWRVDRPRLMPETIYRIAGDDHTEAMRLLRNYGWLG